MAMTIPFLHLFKRKPVTEHPVVARVAPAPIEKPSSERFSKTVLPNSIRTFGQDDSSRRGNGATKDGSDGRGAYSSNAGGLPPAVALALEPKVERAISLELADVVAQMPPGLIRPLQDGDANRRVLLKASEIEKGMASARPTVSISTIYDQVPEIFLNTVAPSDLRQVPLPFAKVLEQFSKLQLRSDQYRDPSVPQVETPFLQVTLEDNTRFGISTEPIHAHDLPPVRVEPATAENIAKAEPEPAPHEKFSLGPRPAIASTSLRNPAPEQRAGIPARSENLKPAPARIAFKLTPNGTDVPATERVPASAGPSVPTSLPAMPGPKRIPFKVGGSSDETHAQGEPWLTKESFEAECRATPEVDTPAPEPQSTEPQNNESEAAASQCKISLPLKPILQSLPPFQLTGDVESVPDDARIELPFSLVEPQLVTGRVTLKPDEFAAALPEEYRGLFSAKDIVAPVALPLQDVLKNLPEASLRIREDQEKEEKGGDFATPFSAKAEEDAKRFNTKAALTPEVSAPPVATAPVTTAAPVPVTAVVVRTALQELLDTDDEVDAKAVVSHVGHIKGVKACSIMFADGLSLAGTLPPEYEAEGLCVLAPSLLHRVQNHLVETKLGALGTMTLSCEQASITFLMEGNLCLAALHAQDGLKAAVRERLTRIVHELSLKYSHPA